MISWVWREEGEVSVGVRSGSHILSQGSNPDLLQSAELPKHVAGWTILALSSSFRVTSKVTVRKFISPKAWPPSTNWVSVAKKQGSKYSSQMRALTCCYVLRSWNKCIGQTKAHNRTKARLWKYSPDVGKRLTNLQLGIYFIKTPVHIAVTMGFFKKVVQDIPSQLSLIHHQRLGAVIVHMHLNHKLKMKPQSISQFQQPGQAAKLKVPAPLLFLTLYIRNASSG